VRHSRNGKHVGNERQKLLGIEAIGQGKPLVAFHGGPGFDHLYLERALSFMQDTRSVVFLTPDCATTTAIQPTFATACEHAADVLEVLAERNMIDIFAHSWGVAVLLGALALKPDIEVCGLLVTPVPTTRFKFEMVRASLMGRFPVEMLAAIAAHDGGCFSPHELAAMLPYYLDQNSIPHVDGLSFNMAQYRSVVSSLGNYDVRTSLPQIAACHVVFGASDFIAPAMVSDIVAACASAKTIPQAGHFPFSEKPQEFSTVARKHGY
jgi:pimeloyl-ACP methyl ester carboxylesterase